MKVFTSKETMERVRKQRARWGQGRSKHEMMGWK